MPDSQPPDSPAPDSKPPRRRAPRRRPREEKNLTHFRGSKFWNEYAWLPFLAPFFLYLGVAGLAPSKDAAGGMFGLSIPYSAYPWFYTTQILLTAASVGICWRVYREFPFRISLLSVAVGVVGIVVWIGACKLQLEQRLLTPIGLGWLVETGERAGYNPFKELSGAASIGSYLGIRFFGLVLVVPLIEEFFLRGFVLRYILSRDWLDVPFGTATTAVIVAAPIYGVLSHPPSEAFAAALWFSLVTWLMIKTKSMWDCVVAHAVTNLLLGVWAITTGDWYYL